MHFSFIYYHHLFHLNPLQRPLASINIVSTRCLTPGNKLFRNYHYYTSKIMPRAGLESAIPVCASKIMRQKNVPSHVGEAGQRQRRNDLLRGVCNHILVFLVRASYSLVNWRHRFKGTRRTWRVRKPYVFPRRWYPPTRLHGFINLKTTNLHRHQHYLIFEVFALLGCYLGSILAERRPQGQWGRSLERHLNS